MSKKKADESKTENTVKADRPLTELMLDCSKDKYRLVTLATRWAQEVKLRDQQSGTTPQELINVALKEILTGQADMGEIEKLPPPPKPDKKLADAAAKAVLDLSPLELDEKEEKKSKKKDKEKDAEEEDEE